MMYMRLLRDLPIHPKHGATAGRVFPCIRHDNKGRNKKAWFSGDVGEECAAYTRFECELYESREAAGGE